MEDLRDVTSHKMPITLLRELFGKKRKHCSFYTFRKVGNIFTLVREKMNKELKVFFGFTACASLLFCIFNTDPEKGTNSHLPVDINETVTYKSDMVFYTKVNKCGSSSMRFILKAMAKTNHFYFHDLRSGRFVPYYQALRVYLQQ